MNKIVGIMIGPSPTSTRAYTGFLNMTTRCYFVAIIAKIW